jgi:hypothetical protein
MIYDDGVELNEDMRVIECPRCENEEFSQDAGYCKICGLRAYNYCEGEPEYDLSGYQTDTIYHKNPSNARYCETCGQPTNFFKEGILQPWAKVKDQIGDDNSFDEVAAAEDDFDDIPF